MEIVCKSCNQPYEEIGMKREPRVLPCGHTFCFNCLTQKSAEFGSFQCEHCFQRAQAELLKFTPINRLYFQMKEIFDQAIRKKQWQSPPRQKDDDNSQGRDRVKQYEHICLYPFCHRDRFQKNGIREVFCSLECRQLNQVLYS